MATKNNAKPAFAYTETGEFKIAGKILKAGDDTKKRVLLGINNIEIKPRLINYAFDMSNRVGGQLEVLQILTPSMIGKTFDCMHDSKVEEMREKGIAYKIITGPGTMEQDLLSYAKGKRNILLVLLGSMKSKKESINYMDVMRQLHCPVVVCSKIM